MVAHAVIQPFPPGLFVLVVLWPLLTPYRRIAPQRFRALVGSHRICFFPAAPSASTSWTLDDVSDFGTFGNLVRPSGLICSLFVQSGFPLELPFPRFVTSPQLFFRSGIPHHRGSLRTFTAVRISRRSYQKAPHSMQCGAFLHIRFQEGDSTLFAPFYLSSQAGE